MSNVWVVTRQFHWGMLEEPSGDVVGVYSTQEQAEYIADAENRRFENIAYDCEVYEVVLNALPKPTEVAESN